VLVNVHLVTSFGWIGLKLHQGRFRLDVRSVAQLPRGGGGITVPGGVQERWRCGTEGCGQWAWWDGLGLDLGMLEVFPNLNDSVGVGQRAAFSSAQGMGDL